MTSRIVTRQEVVDKAVHDWFHPRYGHSSFPAERRYPGLGNQTHAEVSAALGALSGPPYDRNEVVAAFKEQDHTSWTRNECDECSEDFAKIYRFGAEPDYEERWQDLCANCLRKALAMLEG